MRPIRLIGGALLCLLGGACQEPPAGGVLIPSEVPHFSIRGRQASGAEGSPQLFVKVDATGSPLAPGEFASSLLKAMETWSQTGLVQLRLAQPGDPVHVLCAWRRRRHDACPSFGQDTTVAHSGPVTESTFIHFDAERDWSMDGSVGLPLIQVATHELGHVLGLGHSLDEAAVMHPNHDPRRSQPTDSDLAGLAALYGALPKGSGDVWLQSSGQELAPVLQRVAPAQSTGLTTWDVDSNGRDELLLWRTDPEGLGQLMIYHFDAQGRLAYSKGPMVDCVVPQAKVFFCQDAEGAGVLLSVRENGRYSARRFQQGATPKPTPPGVVLVFPEGYADEDGDGVLETLPAGWLLSAAPVLISGDLDGDGEAEQFARLP